MICATKTVGDWTRVRNVPDPTHLFQELCGSQCKTTKLPNTIEGLTALTHVEPDITSGINLEVGGTLLYGTVVFVNCIDGALKSLTNEQIDFLSRYVNIGKPILGEGGSDNCE